MIEQSSKIETSHPDPGLAPIGTDNRHGAGGGRSDRRGNLPDDGRHGEVVGFTILAAGSLVNDGDSGQRGSHLLRCAGGEVSRGRRAVRLPQGGLWTSGGLPFRLAVDAGHRSWYHCCRRGGPGAATSGDLIPLQSWSSRAVAVGSIWLLAAINIRGVNYGSVVIRGLAGLKLGVLGFLVFWGLGLGCGDWTHFVPLVERRPGSEPLVNALIGGMISAFFSLGGWWDVSKLAGEVRDPGRNLPRALLLGVALVIMVYILISLVFVYLVPVERIDSGDTFAALAGEALFGRAGGVVLSLIVIIAVLGSLAALLMAMPRVYFAMARDGLFFPAAATLHTHYQTPARAIVIQASLASLLAVLGTFDEILAYFMVPTVLFVWLTVMAVFVLGQPARNRGEPLSVPWYPISPLLFLVPTTVLLALLAVSNPGHAGIGLGVVLLGVPVYHFVFTKLARLAAPANDLNPGRPPAAGVETT